MPFTMKGKVVRWVELRETVSVLANKHEMPVVLHVGIDVDYAAGYMILKFRGVTQASYYICVFLAR